GCEPGAPAFYNAVVRGRWAGSPEALLKLCLKLEAEAGRPADHPHWHSRILDLDLILFGDRILATEFLTVPHPRAHERLFVMVPLAEIAPEAVFPTLHQNASAILHSLDSREEMPCRVKDASGKGC
ncbi:MAG: 2-amino-4-hydroxy-6-hydroxymethyldihydropteridine diphosphokinase, partial [Victivallales bacterium]